MIQLRRDLDLLLKSLGADRERQLRIEHFERDLSAMPDVLRQVDGGHPATSDFAFDSVTPADSGAQPRRVNYGQRVSLAA
jgi:hypothetical protein